MNVVQLKSNSLAVLAAGIRKAHEDVCRANKYSAERAVDAGRMLAEAKEREDIPRGEWERWVEREASVPHDTAKHYIRLFRAVDEQRLTLTDITEAGQIGALKAVNREIRRREPRDVGGEQAATGEIAAVGSQRVICDDCQSYLAKLMPACIDVVVTSPPCPDRCGRGAATVG